MTGPNPRRDPQPIGQGWEMAVVVFGGTLLTVCLAALAGLGTASAVFGGGWVWPHGTQTMGHVLGGLLAGQPGRGLPPGQAARVPGPVPDYLCIAGCELLLVGSALVAAVLSMRYRRPADARSGLASRAEAARVLGIGQLRAARQIIRPDLYPPAKTRRRSR